MGKWFNKAKAENELLDAADALDSDDHSDHAEYLRDAAGDIRDHLTSPKDD
jgi:hypothetical protein